MYQTIHSTLHFWVVIYSALTKPHARPHALLADPVLQRQRDILGKGCQGLYIPWKVTGMVHSTSALAISVRSLALRMRRYPGLWEPGATTMVSRTPGDASSTSFTVGAGVGQKGCCLCAAVKYRRPRRPHQASGQTEARRGTSLVPAIPRSPWFSHLACRSYSWGNKKGKSQRSENVCLTNCV